MATYGLLASDGSPLIDKGGTVYNVKAYGAVGDGSTDDTAAISSALTAAAGSTLVFPAGTYMVSSGTDGFTVPTKTRLVGEGKNVSIIKKTVNVATALFLFNGASTSTRCQRGGMADIGLDGNGSTTGPLVQAKFADHLDFDRVYFGNNNGMAFYGIELWDSYFHGCEFEWCSRSDGTAPSVYLQGNTTDSTNEVYFAQCRWESFKDGALWIGSTAISGSAPGGGGAHPPYGIYVTDSKMESAVVRGVFINYSNDVQDVHVDRVYLAGDALDTGATAPNMVNFIPLGGCTFQRVHAYIAGSSIRTVFRIFAGAVGHAIRDVYVDAQSAPGVAVIEFAGGTPDMEVRNVRYRSGTGGSTPLYGGTIPYTAKIDTYATATRTITANRTLDATDVTVYVNAASLTVTLPSAATAGAGKQYTIKNTGSGTSTTIASTSGTIDGAATYTGLSAAYASAQFVSDGTNWSII